MRLINAPGRLLCPLIAALGIAVMPGPASARETDRAFETQRKKAVGLFQAGEYLEALMAFQTLERHADDPELTDYIAMCQKALGRYVESIDTLDKFIERWQKKYPKQVIQARREIDQMLTKVGSLLVSGAPKGATISVDGEVMGKTPMPYPIRVNPGRHLIKISKPGHSNYETELVFGFDQELTVDAVLHRDFGILIVNCTDKDGQVSLNGEPVGTCPYHGEVAPGQHEVTVDIPGQKRRFQTVETSVSSVTSVDMGHDVSADSSHRADVGSSPVGRLTLAAWIFGGLAVGGAAAGTVFAYNFGQAKGRAKLASEYNVLAQQWNDDALIEQSERDHKAAVDDFHRDKMGLIVSSIGAGISLGVSIVLLIIDVNSKKNFQRSTVGLAPSPNGLTVVF